MRKTLSIIALLIAGCGWLAGQQIHRNYGVLMAGRSSIVYGGTVWLQVTNIPSETDGRTIATFDNGTALLGTSDEAEVWRSTE